MYTTIRRFRTAALTKRLLPGAIALSLGACVAYSPPPTYQAPYQQPQYSQPQDSAAQYSPPVGNYDSTTNDNYSDNQDYSQPEVEVRVAIAPPPLPVYEQPP